MSLKKKLIIISVAVVLVSLLLWAALQITVASVESCIVSRIQRSAEKLTGSEIYIENVSYDLWNQQAKIQNILFPNPPGYSTTPALTVKQVTCTIAPLMFFNKTLHIKNLTVEGVAFSVELKKTPDNLGDLVNILLEREINLAELKRNKTSFAPHKKSSGTPKKYSPNYIRIDDLAVTGITATLQNYRWFPRKWKTVKLSDLHIKEIGKDKLLPSEELAAELFKHQVEQITNEFKQKAEKIKKKLKIGSGVQH
jgi:hypothetical protein